MARKGGFKNVKLGKNVHRQMKRRGSPSYAPQRHRDRKAQRDRHLVSQAPNEPTDQ